MEVVSTAFPQNSVVARTLPLQGIVSLSPEQQVMRIPELVELILKSGPLLNIRDLKSCGQLDLIWAKEVKKQGIKLPRIIVHTSSIPQLKAYTRKEDYYPEELNMGRVWTKNQAVALQKFGERFSDTINTLQILLPSVVDGMNPFAPFSNLTSLNLTLCTAVKADSVAAGLVLMKLKRLEIRCSPYQKSKDVSVALEDGLARRILKMCPGIMTLRLDDRIHAPFLRRVKKRCDKINELQLYTNDNHQWCIRASEKGVPKLIKKLTYPLTVLDLEVYRGWLEWREELGSILAKFAPTLEKLRIHRINWTLNKTMTVITFPKMAHLEELGITHDHRHPIMKESDNHVLLPIRFTFEEMAPGPNGGGINYPAQFPKLVNLTLNHDKRNGCLELCQMFCPQDSTPSNTVESLDMGVGTGKALRQRFGRVFPNADLHDLHEYE